MKQFSGLFGASLVPVQLTTTQNIVKRIEFFAVKASVTGTPTANSSQVFVGLDSGVLPYIVQPSGTLLLEYATNDTLQDTRNFYLRGANADGYYVISHP